MALRNLRVGIDVGGTFTHAVAVETPSNRIIACAVTPTTHSAVHSVSEGIVRVFKDVMKQACAEPEEICFVAHSTTQATNALLEGDVAKVGVIGMGCGLSGLKAKADTNVKDIELTQGKKIETAVCYINSVSSDLQKEAAVAVEKLKKENCAVIAVSEAFSTENPEKEKAVAEQAVEQGLLATAGCEISQLYGLKIRTRTAVINASILPKMTATAQLTAESLVQSGITAPLMIMRSDGGVMDLAQMKKRPILTMLSGPAAGIAAALMYVKVSDGIFLETGGTSTDISAIKNGKAMMKTAVVGGHLTYLKTLDSRTVGIGGGSMVRMAHGTVADVGPRSAHIAGLSYIAFSDEAELEQVHPELINPVSSDPADYVVAVNEKGKRFALTLTDAAIAAGQIKSGDYAYSNEKTVKNVFCRLAEQMGTTAEKLAEDILTKASSKIRTTVEDLLSEYDMDKDTVSLIGGGGGASSVVPHLAEKMAMNYVIAEKAEVISAIGAALAMLRDSVERTVVQPTERDIAAIRTEVIDRLERMGADSATVEVQIETDSAKNILRATAVGSLHMDKSIVERKTMDEDEILKRTAYAFKVEEREIEKVGQTSSLYVFCRTRIKRQIFGLIKTKVLDYRATDCFGIIKLSVQDGFYYQTKAETAVQDIAAYIEEKAVYNDIGMLLPEVFILYKSRIADYTKILDFSQLKILIKLELEGLDKKEPVLCILHRRT